MNLVCTIDEGYAQHCGVMLCSLFSNNPGTLFRVFVMSDGLTDATRDKLTRVALDSRQQVMFVQVDPRMFQSLRVSGHVSAAGYFRFLIPQILPDDVEKVLFLDSDLIVRGLVTELYEQSVDGYTHAAVVNPMCGPIHKRHPQTLGMPKGAPYFNSGVMLLNLRRWREEQITERVVEYFKANAERMRSWHHDPLNATLHGCWRACHPMWNAQEAFFLDRSADQLEVSEEDLLTVQTNPRIVHFTGTSKPWGYYHVHPFRRDYFKYLARTPWRGYRPVDRPPAPVRARLMASRLAPSFVKNGYRKLAGRGLPGKQ